MLLFICLGFNLYFFLLKLLFFFKLIIVALIMQSFANFVEANLNIQKRLKLSCCNLFFVCAFVNKIVFE